MVAIGLEGIEYGANRIDVPLPFRGEQNTQAADDFQPKILSNLSASLLINQHRHRQLERESNGGGFAGIQHWKRWQDRFTFCGTE